MIVGKPKPAIVECICRQVADTNTSRKMATILYQVLCSSPLLYVVCDQTAEAFRPCLTHEKHKIVRLSLKRYLLQLARDVLGRKSKKLFTSLQQSLSTMRTALRGILAASISSSI